MFNKLVVAALPLIPRPIVRRVSMRYIAGDYLQDAIDTARTLHETEGARATIDVLGEFVEHRDQSLTEKSHCRGVLEAIVAHDLVGTAGLSIKPTSLGLGIDFDFAYANIRELALLARERGIFMRIDMENTPYTDATLKVYRRLRDEGIDNVGVVFQAMLRRTAQDIRDLAEYNPDIRLCKVIYRESEEVAWQGREEVRESFKELLRQIKYLQDLLEMWGDYIDGFKFAGGSQRLLSADILKKIINICHNHNVYVSTGGFVERVIVQGTEAVDRYLQECKLLGFDVVEVSSGLAPIPLKDKVEIVKQVKKMGMQPKPEISMMFGAGAGTTGHLETARPRTDHVGHRAQSPTPRT